MRQVKGVDLAPVRHLGSSRTNQKEFDGNMKIRSGAGASDLLYHGKVEQVALVGPNRDGDWRGHPQGERRMLLVGHKCEVELTEQECKEIASPLARFVDDQKEPYKPSLPEV